MAFFAEPVVPVATVSRDEYGPVERCSSDAMSSMTTRETFWCKIRGTSVLRSATIRKAMDGMWILWTFPGPGGDFVSVDALVPSEGSDARAAGSSVRESLMAALPVWESGAFIAADADVAAALAAGPTPTPTPTPDPADLPRENAQRSVGTLLFEVSHTTEPPSLMALSTSESTTFCASGWPGVEHSSMIWDPERSTWWSSGVAVCMSRLWGVS